MAAKDYANTRYSGLNEITTDNVGSLKPAWTFSTGVLRGQEAAPLVVNGTMYVVTPYPNTVYALDLTKPGAPTRWVYKSKPSAAAQGVACCDTVNRGAAYADGKIFFNALDAHTIAVDAATGKEVWKTMVGDFRRGERGAGHGDPCPEVAVTPSGHGAGLVRVGERRDLPDAPPLDQRPPE